MARQESFSSFSVLAFLLTIAAPPIWPQSTPLPTTYTVTQVNSMMGPAVTETVYRSGSKALVDMTMPPSPDKPKGFHTRALYDLQANTSFDWNLNQTPMPCSAGAFSGAWGDPFADSVAEMADLVKQNPKQVGTETVNGIATKIFEIEQPVKARIWLDAQYGEAVKTQMTEPGGQPQIISEIKQISLAAPPASLFVLPADCAAAAAAPRVPTEAERIAAETGGNAADFANAIYPPGSDNSCTVLYRVVRAGSMETIASGFQVAVDIAFDPQHPPSYTTGDGAHPTFSGGGIHEVTAQMRNSVLRIDNAPKVFYLDTYFGTAGDSSAMIYRHCFAPQTVLLYVVKNPAKISDGGDWLYVKSGKYATVNPPR
jgi:hypothetical protein